MSIALGLEVETLSMLGSVRHGFSTRIHDRERFLEYALGAGDGAIDGSRLVTVKQVHGARIFDVRDGCDGATAPEGYDALVCARPGIAVGILTADCVPVLLADDDQTVVTAVHAGWRGAAAEIIVRVVEYLEREHGVAPDRLRAAIGPAIGSCCFEVGPEVVAGLAAVCEHPEAWTVCAPGAKPHVDLVEVNRRQLVAAGVSPEAIGSVGICTRCDSECFASYRREGPAAGRQLSVIALAP